jgi:predicted RNase H-like nuclease (RuvC/YqgF family)
VSAREVSPRGSTLQVGPLGTFSDPSEGSGGEQRGKAEGKIQHQGKLLRSYLQGLTHHRINLDEYLGQLDREREDLERERLDLERRIEANEKKRDQVTRYIDEIPRLRDRTLRSLMRGMEELEDD